MIKENNSFSKELISAMKNTRSKYQQYEHGNINNNVEDGVYNVKIENIKFKISRKGNNLFIIDSSIVKTGEVITSNFVLNEDLQEINFQELRTLTFITGNEDISNEDIENPNLILERLKESIGHKVKLELKTTDSGFQTTSFIDTMDGVDEVETKHELF